MISDLCDFQDTTWDTKVSLGNKGVAVTKLLRAVVQLSSIGSIHRYSLFLYLPHSHQCTIIL